MAIKKQVGPGPKKAAVKKSPGFVGPGHGDNRTAAQRKAAAEFQGPNSTYAKRKDSIIKQQEYEDSFQKTGKAKKGADYASSREYGGAFASSKVLDKDNMYKFTSPSKAGIAKKPSTTKAPAAGTASKKDVRSYKKTMRKK
jgi:hypothetical protein